MIDLLTSWHHEKGRQRDKTLSLTEFVRTRSSSEVSPRPPISASGSQPSASFVHESSPPHGGVSNSGSYTGPTAGKGNGGNGNGNVVVPRDGVEGLAPLRIPPGMEASSPPDSQASGGLWERTYSREPGFIQCDLLIFCVTADTLLAPPPQPEDAGSMSVDSSSESVSDES